MSGAELVFVGLLGLVLVPIAVIDARERRIPNWPTLALALLGLAHAWLLGPGWRAALLGGAIAVALLGISVGVMRLLSRRARIGLGDLKFLAASSLWVGWDGSIAVLFVASLLATLTAFALAPWQGLDLGRMRPFGPMLAVGMLAVVGMLGLRHGGTP
jgi:leader peptidase (prepilin peptidase)/N-methyltransferase